VSPPPGPGTHEQSEGVFRSIVDRMADAVLVVDAEGTVCYANRAAAQLFGQGRSELVGDTFGFPLSPGERTEIDLVGPVRTARVAEMRVTTVEWDGQHAYLAAVRDVTDRHTVEQSLRDVVSTVSHEFRSPLAVIDGFVDVLLEDAPDWEPEEAVDYLERISGQIERMSRLANDLLAYARLDAGENQGSPEGVDLRAAVEQLCAEHAATGTRISGSVPDDLVAWVDPDHLHRILDNLLRNAVKYGAPPVAIEAEEGDGAVVIRVRDHGDGVDPGFVPHLFDRFSRDGGQRGDGSSGLGLPIVLGLARASDGDVWYEDDGDGAVFAVRLPVPAQHAG
jgi:signal transduction histidine kinase